MPDIESIKQAHRRIKPYIHETPVLTSSIIDEMTSAELYFKAEHLQKVGAFKARGATNVVFSLDDDAARLGVATHSSGNHGAALARAARLRGIPAFIVVPENAKQTKIDAITSYGGEVIKCKSTLKAREEKLDEVVERTGAWVVHPYDDDGIIAGQGTAALELMDQVPDLDAIVVPVGGGGLLSGCAIVAKETERIRVYGAEPAEADDAYRSFTSGILVTSHEPATMADGLLTTLGERNFRIIQDKVDGILLVSEAEIVDAMKLVWTRMKQVIEPSSAVTLAAVFRYPDKFQQQKVGLVMTGGNVDLSNLPF